MMLLIANAAIGRLAASTVPRQRLRAISLGGRASDIFLGNSLMAAALDTAAFAAAAPSRHALNLGLGATSPVEHYLLLLAAGHLRPEATYYGFADMELTDSVTGSFEDLVGNRAMAYYVYPDSAIRFYASNDALLRAELRVFRFIPMVVNRSAYWGKVETLRRKLYGLGTPAEKFSRFGRASDFSLLEAADPNAFRSRIRFAVDHRSPLSPSVSSLLKLANRNSGAVFCVVMPMPISHRLRFYETPEWHSYLSYVSAVLQRNGVQVIDASDWILDDEFEDPIHLSPKGAAIFSRRLANTVLPRLAVH